MIRSEALITAMVALSLKEQDSKLRGWVEAEKEYKEAHDIIEKIWKEEKQKEREIELI